MRTLRATNPGVVDMIKDRMTEQSDRYVEGLKEAMRASPEYIYVLVTIQDEEIVAFLVGSADPQSPFAWIHQAWRKPELDWDVADRMFLRFTAWVEEKSKAEIRMETQRNPNAFLRRWNFEVVTTIMSFQLMDQEGVYNGRQSREGRDQEQEHDQQATGSGEQGAGVVPEPADRQG